MTQDLSQLISAGNVDKVRTFLQLHPYPAEYLNNPQWDYPPLSQAVYTGDVEMVRAVLEFGADANIRDGAGATPLFPAVREGHGEIVDLLFEHGANPHFRNNNQFTLYHVAVWAGDEVGESNPETIGRLEQVHRMIQARAPLDEMEPATVNSPDWQGNTALHDAARKGRLDAVQWCVLHGADIDAKNSDGRTAQQVAQREQSDHEGLTALTSSARFHMFEPIATALKPENVASLRAGHLMAIAKEQMMLPGMPGGPVS